MAKETVSLLYHCQRKNGRAEKEKEWVGGNIKSKTHCWNRLTNIARIEEKHNVPPIAPILPC